VYTYTVAGNAPCPNDQSTVTITVTNDPDPGTNGTITLCTIDGSVDLFASLGGTPDPGGSWSFNGIAHGGLFDPTIDIQGNYTYTITVPPPCTSQSSTVIVTTVQPPDAGMNGNVLLCQSGVAMDLFSQLGNAQPGGSWTFNGATHGNLFTPGMDAPGTYTYSVAGSAPCPGDQATVTVAVTSDPDPGLGGNLTLCASDAPVDLLTAIGGTPDAGGSWSFNGVPHTSTLYPGLDGAGTYTYTLSAPPPCASQSSTVNVTIIQPPTAGTDGNALLCISSPPLDLFTQLTGAQPGGSWTFNGSAHSNTFVSGTDAAGVYTYTVTGDVPCPADESTVTVAVTNEPDPGTNGATVMCAGSTPIDLFSLLAGTPDAGGSWSLNGQPHGAVFDPAVDAAGVYTYTIAVPPPCTNASSTVTVLLQAPPDAGQDGALTLCSTSPATQLFSALIGAEPGGSWTFNGASHGSNFQPGTDAAGTYTYTVQGIAPCPDDQAVVVVAVNTPPDAGQDATLTVCTTGTAQDLFPLLGGSADPGGSWTVTGAAHNGLFDPAVDVAGTFTYTVSGAAPCPNNASLVVVSTSIPPDAGSDPMLTLCATGAPVDLFAQLGGTPDTGGSWSGPSPIAAGLFDPATMTAGAYIYTVTGISPCPDDAAQVNVALTPAPDAGMDGALLLCVGSPAVALFEQLTGTPQSGGTWSFSGAAHSGTFDPALDANGVYTYTVDGNAPCPAASASVTMTVTSTPDAGTPGAGTLCASDGALPLLGLLGGTPDAGGVWTGPDGTAHSSMFDPGMDAPGTYTYAINVPPPCVSTSSTVTINLVQPANPGTNGSVTLCTTSAVVDLWEQLEGTPDAGGQWTFNGQSHGNALDPSTDVSGAYVYTLTSTAPCPSVSAVVDVAINMPPDAGIDGAVTLCASSPAISLFTELGGTPQAGGSWSHNGTPHADSFDPATDLAGDHVYTVIGTAPCPSASALVTVNVLAAPDPGTDGAVDLCTSSPPVDLFEQLGGTPDAGGSWSGPSAVTGSVLDPGSMVSGTYTYTIAVPPPCTSAASQVVVNVQVPPDPGTDGAMVLCVGAAACDLFGLLGGSPEAGGAWSGPDGQPHLGLFNPATDAPGAYTYSVNGMLPCPAASAQVIMTVTAEPDPGSNGSILLCATDGTIDLFAQLGGTPDAGGSWSGPSAVQGGQFDPATMQAGLYTYTITVAPPCESASSLVLVTVTSPPDPGTPGNATLCSTDGPQDLFALLGGGPDADGAWSFNGLPHGTSFDPAIDAGGAYTYTVPGMEPCAAASSAVVMNVVLPPHAGADGSITVCPDAAPADLFDALGGSPGGGGAWTAPGGVGSDGQFNPSTDEPGIYTYTLTATAPCTNDEAIVVTSIAPAIQATAVVNDAICNGSCDGAALLQVSGGTPQHTFQWSGGVAGPTDAEAAGLCAGAYAVVITDAAGCQAAVDFTIGQPPPLVIDAVTATDELCPGQCDGTATASDPMGVLFSIDGGATWQASPSFAGLCAGGYTLAMQDANGCLASIPIAVASPQAVLAAFTAVNDTVTAGASLVAFMNQSAHATTFMWDFGGLGTSTEGNPAFTFPDVLGGTYDVCLTAMNTSGCADTTCHPVVVIGELVVHVPNAFTPNDDGMNEGFAPVFNTPQLVDDYEFLVFDRWGELIFESGRIGEAWDGRMAGELVKLEVYVWKLRFTDVVTRKKHDRIGHVTLLK
jgi:gliding motility-associated-like protein